MLHRKPFYLLIALILGLLYLSYAGDPAERRKNVHSGNQIRTTFFNYGLLGRLNAAQDFGLEWPINTGHFYIGDLDFMVGAEVRLPSGEIFHSVEVHESPRGDNEYNPNDPNDFWGWEPLAGFANPMEQLVAMSQQPNSWPPAWQGWLGIPGNTGIAEQEGYFVVDDATDREFFFNHGFLPDSTDPNRYGMGWRVKVHSYQFSDSFLRNALVFKYTIINEGTTFYPKTCFAMIVGNTIGGDGDTDDDNANYDLENSLIYSWDYDNIGNTGWTPVGMLGVALLETPGIDFDGIDNDGDGQNGSGDIIDEAMLLPQIAQTGNPIVLIDYTTYDRTVTTMPPGGVTFTYNGEVYQIFPGDTLLELSGNNVDDNLNGIIDENSEIPNDGIDNNLNSLIDEPNHHLGKKYINYFTGFGSSNPLIDESKFDFIDNDGDWNVQFDDVGIDGIPNTGDPGEGDGMPSSGVGTGFPGEPHIDLTDPDEADETGITSFLHFAPFNIIRLRDDAQLWSVSRPGYLTSGQQNIDGDVIFGSGYFPSVPGDSQQVAIGLVMGNNLNDLLVNAQVVRNYYRENFHITGIEDDEFFGVIDKYYLRQNYPNPFNPTTTIEFYISRRENVKIEIFDLSGRRVRTLIDQSMQPGKYKLEWDGRNASSQPVASGIYFYRLSAGDFVQSRKMILLR